METVTAKKPFVVHPNDDGTYGFGFGTVLPTDVTVSSVVSVVVSGGDGALTSASPAVVSSQSVDALGNTIEANEGASAKLSGGTAGQDYEVTVTITDSTSEKIAGVFPVLCRN